MAKLTPLAKGLITVTILAVAGAAAWQLGLREVIEDAMGGGSPVAGGPSGEGTSGSPTPTPTTPPPSSGGPLGSAGNPLKVSIVSFHGYAPALVANGNALKTKPGSIFAQEGVNVEFIIQDDIPTLATIFTSKTAQCAWRTSDFWAQEHPNLRNAGLDGRAVVIVDNTQGADAIIARDPSINRVEDLTGKKVALLQYTPSHGMVIDAIDNSSLSARKKQRVNYVYINADEGTAGVRAAFESGSVDAAALWDPDLSLALKNTSGAKVVYSTKTATNLIFDVMVCNKAVLDDPANTPVIQSFVTGWMKGVDAARAEPAKAFDALVATEEFFALLSQKEGKGFVMGLFDNLVWTGIADNARILGLSGGTDHYSRVYKRFDQIYRAAGALANPNSPVINPAESFDTRYIEKLLAANPAEKAEAAKPVGTFDSATAAKASAQPAILTKPVSVNFKTGSSSLSKRAQKTIDDDMVPLIENNGQAYFEVSGNTDATGSRRTNKRLSLQRSQAVVKYLVEEWEFRKERFLVVGNGSEKPLCRERNFEADGDYATLDDCRAANRSTRIAVLTN
ncbi:MAG: phosphate ABC transporter substrate-binding/OmpA family protein [Myxococcota bacterium]